METFQSEGFEVLASDPDNREVTVRLIPFGEVGRTNAGLFEVQAGIIDLPADPSVVSLNLDHDRFAPVGRATRIWEEPQGIMARFAFARTPQGDAAFADAINPEGKRRRVSAEFKVGIKAGRAVKPGVLAAAALLEAGAFPSAMVLAADTPDLSEPVTESSSTSRYTDRFTDADGVEWERVSESTSTTTVTEVGESDPDDTEENANPEGESEVTATAIPATQRGNAPAATTQERGTDLTAILAAMADVNAARRTGRPADDAAVAVLAALSDIKISGAGALPVGGGVIRENWVGQLYQGIPYERQYITLGTLGTNITAGGKKGYTLERGTSGSPVEHFDGTWSGNKTAIPSGVGFTASKASELFRFAFGVDIAREFFDLPGGAEVIEAFLRLIVEDHLVWSDEIARQTWVTVAGAPVAPKTYPGVDGHDYAGALGQLIQGILAVKAKKADGRRDLPTFAIANELAYEQLVYTPKDLVPEFVNFTANTANVGDVATADGLRVVLGDTGVEATASVIVGSSKAVEFDELAGGPLHIDALDIARGGVDKAVHGYLQRFIVRPEAVVHIGVADA